MSAQPYGMLAAVTDTMEALLSSVVIEGHSQPCPMAWQTGLLDGLHLDFLFVFLILNCTFDPCFPLLPAPSAPSWSGSSLL